MTAWMIKAAGEIGQKEIPGKKHNPRVVGYFDATGYQPGNDETPWCGAFVAWAFKQAGIEYADVRNVAAGARRWLEWGKEIKVADSFYGCLMILSRTGSPTAGHVTFFTEWVDKERGIFKGLGGNQGNAVSIAEYNVRDVLGVRWPSEIPLPASHQKLRDSGVMRWSVFGTGGALAILTDNASDLVDAINQADQQLSAGTVLGAVAAGIVIAACIGIIVSRVRGQKAERKIEGGLDSDV